MAVPKKKQSHSRTAKRRAQHKIGTPAVIKPNVAPQTLAIELEPFDSKMSEITRIV